ncbi:hypothetical protein ACAW74_22610 [Fibrella sp. WM1]|uniref:hypothetical protein n=1 Tax=Fibrella musci TaxID=3242485 RepID=UPI0035219711
MMKRVLNSVSLALAGAALLTACSRPVATFQPSKTERFYTQQTTAAPVATPVETQAAPVAETTTNVPVTAETALAAPSITVQTKQASEALASLKATHASDKRMTRRIERAETMLAEASAKASASATAQPVATTKKAGLAQRLMLKSMNQKIQKHLAPKETKASFTGYVRLGAIIGLIGLLLLLIGNGVGATIGLIALIAGLVLILLGVINEG